MMGKMYNKYNSLSIFLIIFLCIPSVAIGISYVESSSGLIPPNFEGGRTELEFADVNQDGHIDIVSIGDHGSPYINTDQHGIMVWFGAGDGTWDVEMNGNFGYGGIAIGDVNNDGYYDAGYGMHHNYGSGDFGNQLIEVALGDGTGTSWSPWDNGLATNGESWGMFGTDFGDVNNDGLLDVGSVSFGAGAGVHVYLNQGDGSWEQSFGFLNGNSTMDFVFGDINNDTYLDFAVAHQYGTIYLNDGEGDFESSDTGLPSGGIMGLRGVSLGDVDNDGGADLSFVHNGGVNVYIFDEQEESWEDYSGSLPVSGNYESTQLYDMNVDGYMDVVAFGEGLCRLWLGNGMGSWSYETQFTTPSPGEMAAFRVGGDADNNGFPDIALVADEGGFWNSQNTMHFFKESSEADELDIHPIYPNGYETFWHNSVRFIDWVSAVPDNENSWVTLEYTTTGEWGTWNTIADSLPNNGRYQWTIPSEIWSDYCKIRYTVHTQNDSISAVTPNYFSITGEMTDVKQPNSIDIPEPISMNCFPNPFNPEINIQFNFQKETDVNVSIYDVTGTLVKTIIHDHLTAGRYQRKWNGLNDTGDNVSSGIYLVYGIMDNQIISKKIVLLK